MPLGILTTIGFEAILRVFDCDMPKGTQRFRGVTSQSHLPPRDSIRLRFLLITLALHTDFKRNHLMVKHPLEINMP